MAIGQSVFSFTDAYRFDVYMKYTLRTKPANRSFYRNPSNHFGKYGILLTTWNSTERAVVRNSDRSSTNFHCRIAFDTVLKRSGGRSISFIPILRVARRVWKRIDFAVTLKFRFPTGGVFRFVWGRRRFFRVKLSNSKEFPRNNQRCVVLIADKLLICCNDRRSQII